MRVLALYTATGGTGKSTATADLAAAPPRTRLAGHSSASASPSTPFASGLNWGGLGAHALPATGGALLKLRPGELSGNDGVGL